MIEDQPHGSHRKFIGPSNQKWVVDSGASRNFRDPSLALESDRTIDSINVEVAGGGENQSSQDLRESGEVDMEGSPLLSVGRAVRIGNWTSTWTNSGGPKLSQLTHCQECRINKIMDEGCDTICPNVELDVPFVGNQEALVLRKTMDMRDESSLGDRLMALYSGTIHEGSESVYIGTSDNNLKALLKSSNKVRMILEKLRGSSNFNTSDIFEIWSRSDAEEDFVKNLLCYQEHGSCEHTTSTDEVQEVKEVPAVETENVASEKNVFFGHVQVHEFDIDEPVANELDSTESVEEQVDKFFALRAEGCDEGSTDVDPHLLTHFPADPKCRTCQEFKKKHAPMQRGKASHGDSPGAADGPFLVMDWVCPTQISSNGHHYLGVVAWTQKGITFTKGVQTKKGSVVDLLHDARVEWGIEDQPFTFHTDREGILIKGNKGAVKYDENVAQYLRENKGIPWYGVPRRSNTNARAEAYVQSACAGIRAILGHSGIPTKFWSLAADAWTVLNMRQKQVSSRINQARSIPFGTLGKAILPKGIIAKDKFDSRISFVAHLGYDRRTTTGVRVLYMGANGVLKRTTIMDRDVSWLPGQYALSTALESLHTLYKHDERLECHNAIKDFEVQACCDSCDKWRFIPERFKEVADLETFECKND